MKSKLNIPLLRCLNQQIISQQYPSPEQVLLWLGMMQAQSFSSAKEALALRIKSTSNTQSGIKKVEKALNDGSILRTHVLRTTWQFVSAENIRWMIDFSHDRNERFYTSYLRRINIIIKDNEYELAFKAFQELLQGNLSMTKAELIQKFTHLGLPNDSRRMQGYIWMAENQSILCSGKMNGTNSTYALMDERVPSQETISKEEALSRLARIYFRGHGPAKPEDFQWWAGISKRKTQTGIDSIQHELLQSGDYFYHKECRTQGVLSGKRCLLPAYDEYIIGYADRTDILPKDLEHHCYTRNGLFFPTYMEDGQIVGSIRSGKDNIFR
ncbi:winged helix DNA-binding domain-containing protein [Bacteroides pyogenes]|uniref:Winged helix DNA-binding domain-containing protein n=1 Tax=Bacteroides pyogenes TaxID=310300 RepID=A0A5D3E9C3_9BACE|nr:winged helix DNA-binding domain-containing protein [Bacteroides pyogenes]MBR8706528.1 hypothetical protein [Bacteroides pyogenes]MCE9106453.1 winged helix DNA-binding domain-containing protein [Bacteroides pyogenes]TYK32624.1 winged helix DNA-binding domain-containing protein [Bacteroides pyogenes]TYK34835.1 winged helix DNA-binding domain-containing protein [Bacteroides pyogenes]TYK50285.1 winged helix DNA-binding domain-containing protein [Bacteroides pyogenes]